MQLFNCPSSVNIAIVVTVRYTINANGRPRVPRRSLTPTSETMAAQSTRNQSLTLLKRSAGSTVEDLASALELARLTVRHHLATLHSRLSATTAPIAEWPKARTRFASGT